MNIGSWSPGATAQRSSVTSTPSPRSRLPELMAVHELLHVILEFEGYPCARLDKSKLSQSTPYDTEFEYGCTDLTILFVHPEIYRRTVDVYGLDFQPFRAFAARELGMQTESLIRRGVLSFPLGKQIQLFNIRNLLHLRAESAPTLDRYRAVCEPTHSQAVSLDAKVAAIGMLTAAYALKAAAVLNEHLIEFGEALGDDAPNGLWRATVWEPWKNS